MPRIISLLSSSTEMVYALGMGDALVGRSHECDYPPEVKQLPQCTETKFNPDGTSYQIDERIKAILQEGLSVYRVLAEQLEALKPDVILTQTQCEVCAVSLKDVEQAVCQLVSSRPEIVALEPHCLEDLWKDIASVARAIGCEERGASLIASLQERVETIRQKAQPLPRKPRVACVEWIEPLMAAGNWMPELIELAGGVSLFGVAGKHSPWMSWESLQASDPDVILVLPCGYDLKKTREEMPALTRQPGYSELRAVREGRVYLADGNQYFNRPGPRLVESLEILAELLHPEDFSFGHRDRAYELFELRLRPGGR